MRKILLKNGTVIEVENNEAHALIDKGDGRLYTKEMERPKADKMISKRRKKIITK